MVLFAALGPLAACGAEPGVQATAPGEKRGSAVDVSALTPNTVCDAVPVDTVASITGRKVSDGKGEVGACEWKAPQAVRVRLFPPGEWSPHTDSGGYRELASIGAKAYVAKGTFGNGYRAEALLDDRAIAAIIPGEWATEDMATALLRAAVERLG
ncbi:hypothetical protein [Alloactinosynnema sp. L-07]|nr:hypothetical protein [Alloactinosynnema sp. L-07]